MDGAGKGVRAISEASIRATVWLCQVFHQAGMWPEDNLVHPGDQSGGGRRVYLEHLRLESRNSGTYKEVFGMPTISD